MESQEALKRTIDAQRKRIVHLQQTLQVERERLNALEAELRAAPPRTASRLTPDEKIRLFRSLFRGREDVWPQRWQSAKSGKSGYSPVCRNEWVRGVCEKPRVKCSECAHRVLVPVSDESIRAHLIGQLVAGVYPLLEDETCWFLAADFDKRTWTDDVLAFAVTAREMGVPVAIERSRSGNGAHAWLFFAAPVAAALARRMGCYLLTETMRRHRDLSLDSYDRLFPNQDFMPRGGFGNLIALPLQGEARARGNSVFVDDGFAPLADQWAYLVSLERMFPERVAEIAREGQRRGRIVGVRAAESEDDEAPWALPIERRAPRLKCGLPATLRVVLAQRLFVETEQLASPALNAIKRLAAFQNPEFFKLQNLRMSTARTPRVIRCAEELAHHVSLPRGCLSALEAFAGQHGSRVIVEDQRTATPQPAFQFAKELTEGQHVAAQALFPHDTGIYVAPPGSGKTVLGAWMIAARARNTLIIVHRKPLADQWVARLCLFLGVSVSDIGFFGGTKRKLNGRLDVAMFQSLERAEDLAEVLAAYGHVIVDECHHVPAVSFEKVMSNVRAQYVLGLTATPRRRDGLHPIGEMQLGPVRFTLRGEQRPFALELISASSELTVEDTGLSIQALYKRIAAASSRNALVVRDVRAAVAEGRWPLVVTERKDHLLLLANLLADLPVPIVLLHGGMGARQRREVEARLAETAEQQRVLLAIGKYVGEGFDDPRLDTLFLVTPVSWRGTVEQYAGRLHRLHPDKRSVRIYDYVDERVPVLARMADRRTRALAALGYMNAVGQLELGFADVASRHFTENPAAVSP